MRQNELPWGPLRATGLPDMRRGAKRQAMKDRAERRRHTEKKEIDALKDQ